MDEIRKCRRDAERHSSEAEDIYRGILESRTRSNEQINELLNRFGANAMSIMAVAEFRNLMSSVERAGNFCDEAISNYFRIRGIEMDVRRDWM